MKIGVMFGNPETTTGGNALKFYSSVRLDIRRIASVKQGEEVVGSRVKVKVVKNKVAAPFKTAEFDVMFGTGFSRIGDMIDLAVAKNIVAKTGAWFAYKEERLGQGRENAKEFLEQNPAIAKRVEKEVLAAYGLGSKDAADAAPAKDARAVTGAVRAPDKDPSKDSKDLKDAPAKAGEPQRVGAEAGASAAVVNGASGAGLVGAKLAPKKPAMAASK